MREIKFRAWHKDRSFMLFVGDDWGTTKPLDCCVYANQGQPVILMQYTGLKDKNGKEIYEGDILHWVGLKLPITVDDFHGYRFMFGKDSLCRAFAIEGEVIGNIYETPKEYMS